jgi:hypothetical protein
MNVAQHGVGGRDAAGRRAAEAIETGRALDVLDSLVRITNEPAPT